MQFGGHYTLFVPAIKNLGNKAQCDKWMPDALAARIHGGYALTELGHGSNAQGIETLATFDKQSDSFIIHTPHV